MHSFTPNRFAPGGGMVRLIEEANVTLLLKDKQTCKYERHSQQTKENHSTPLKSQKKNCHAGYGAAEPRCASDSQQQSETKTSQTKKQQCGCEAAFMRQADKESKR